MRISSRNKPTISSAFLVGVAAAAGAAAAGPLVRRVMLRSGILDEPNERSSHTAVVPRGGGWACLVGAVSGYASGWALGYDIPWRTVAGAVALGLVGFADDRWNVSAPHRLAAQASIGLVADVSDQHFPLGLATVPTLVNVVNFMDGINAITALTTLAWGAGAAGVGIRSNNGHVALLGASLAGATLGFLPHNLRRDRMFLGDIGSYFIGAVMALTALHPSLSWPARKALLMPLLPYLADTGTTLARRVARGDSVISAHREHAYQKLANDHQLGHVPVALAYGAATATLATLGVLTLPEGRK